MRLGPEAADHSHNYVSGEESAYSICQSYTKIILQTFADYYYEKVEDSSKRHTINTQLLQMMLVLADSTRRGPDSLENHILWSNTRGTLMGAPNRCNQMLLAGKY